MLRQLVDHVIGVDTARDVHAAAVVEAMTCGVVDEVEVNANGAGYEGVLAWADDHSEADCRAWAIEGTGSYGAGLCRYLRAAGELVIEIDRPKRDKTGAKSDALDAVRAAREALGRTKLASPRRGGDREALRVVQAARNSAVSARTRSINLLKSLVLTSPPALRETVAAKPNLVTACASLRTATGKDREWQTTAATLRDVARRIRALEAEIERHTATLDEITAELVPDIRAEAGVGPFVGAQLVISYSHSERWPGESSFSMLAGTSPIPATSGQTVNRFRLNRGGDRQLNRALHTVALYRRRTEPHTQAYIARRVAEGKTEREATRCLKRYLARHFYRKLEQAFAT